MGLMLTGVSKSFGSFQAINELSLEVMEGALFGFLGPNGAGKTTTMRMILDILRPDSGSITWNSKDVREVPRRNWGYLPEERGLYPKMRVDEQLLFLARLQGVSKPDARKALAQLLTFLDTAHRLGLTSAQTQRLVAPPDLTVTRTQQSQNTLPQSESTASYVLATAGVILIFISISIYGAIVAAGVAEEKSSRTMELLVNAATPFQLLAGKIVGIGAACLTQMGGVVVVGIAALLLQTPVQAALFGAHAGGFSQYLTGVSIPFYLLFLLYVLLAFFLYATLFAGLASMVKRQEEVQSATILPVLLMVIGYLLFFLTVATPDATVTKVLSYIPFWTPILMLMRLAVGTVAWWEIVVTVALMLLTILACTWFAARLYRYGVLMYGQRPGLGQLLKLVRMN